MTVLWTSLIVVGAAMIVIAVWPSILPGKGRVDPPRPPRPRQARPPQARPQDARRPQQDGAASPWRRPEGF